jgi:hypothetical protein
VTRTGISFSPRFWHINGVPELVRVRIIQSYQLVLEFVGNKRHLLRRARDQGSKMRREDHLTFRRELDVGGLITLRRVEVHAKPTLATVGG